MKVFILEDDQNRMDWFDENLEAKDVDATDLAEEGMELLRENTYDIILLDHDLGGDVFVDSSVFNTGFTVAKMIHETNNKKTPVVIHSWNSQGANLMKQTLTQNGVQNAYYPFLSKEFVEVVERINDQEEEEKEED